MRCQCVGPTVPDRWDAVTSDDADQASVAVLSIEMGGKLKKDGHPAMAAQMAGLFARLARKQNARPAEGAAISGAVLTALPFAAG